MNFMGMFSFGKMFADMFRVQQNFYGQQISLPGRHTVERIDIHSRGHGGEDDKKDSIDANVDQGKLTATIKLIEASENKEALDTILKETSNDITTDNKVQEALKKRTEEINQRSDASNPASGGTGGTEGKDGGGSIEEKPTGRITEIDNTGETGKSEETDDKNEEVPNNKTDSIEMAAEPLSPPSAELPGSKKAEEEAAAAEEEDAPVEETAEKPPAAEKESAEETKREEIEEEAKINKPGTETNPVANPGGSPNVPGSNPVPPADSTSRTERTPEEQQRIDSEKNELEELLKEQDKDSSGGSSNRTIINMYFVINRTLGGRDSTTAYKEFADGTVEKETTDNDNKVEALKERYPDAITHDRSEGDRLKEKYNAQLAAAESGDTPPADKTEGGGDKARPEPIPEGSTLVEVGDQTGKIYYATVTFSDGKTMNTFKGPRDKVMEEAHKIIEAGGAVYVES